MFLETCHRRHRLFSVQTKIATILDMSLIYFPSEMCIFCMIGTNATNKDFDTYHFSS